MTNVIYSGIYIITNKINGKKYVGQSINLQGRARAHLKGRSTVGKAIKKYGKENFTFQFFEAPIEVLNLYEEIIVDCLNTLSPNGYNLKEGGGSKGKPSAETKARMSAAKKGKTMSEEARARMSAAGKGRTLSEEHKAKIGAAQKGKTLSAEHKAKLSAAKQNMSEETRAKIGAAQKGKTLSEETKAKLSESLKGKKTGAL